MLTIANLLTLLRLVLVPFIFFSIIKSNIILALILFIIASFTDVLDGFVARLRNEETVLGACLDPVADKLLVLSCYLGFTFISSTLGFQISTLFTSFIFVKELLLILGSVGLLLTGNAIYVRPSILGKTTAFSQILFIALLFVFSIFSLSNQIILNYFMSIIVLLNLVTFMHYAVTGYFQYRGLNL